jgi:hypothetical protein
MKTGCSAACVVALAIFSSVASAQSVSLSDAERRYVLQQAHDLQYNLRTAGLEEFRCEVKPDWDGFFRQLGIDTTSPESIVPLLRRVHFTAAVNADGQVTVTHTGVASPNAGKAAAMRAALSGMDNMITGALKTWSMYALASPLPAVNGEYEVHPDHEDYVVMRHEGATLVRTTLDSQFAIEEVRYSSPQLEITMHPGWNAGQYGYLLTGYDGVTQTTRGDATRESLQISYQGVDGFALPETVKATTTGPKGNVELVLSFWGYEVTSRGRGRHATTVSAKNAEGELDAHK